MQQAFFLGGDVEPFFREKEYVSFATWTKLLEFFDDPQNWFLFKLDLTIKVDLGVHFVKATCTLEGDGVL